MDNFRSPRRVIALYPHESLNNEMERLFGYPVYEEHKTVYKMWSVPGMESSTVQNRPVIPGSSPFVDLSLHSTLRHELPQGIYSYRNSYLPSDNLLGRSSSTSFDSDYYSPVSSSSSSFPSYESHTPSSYSTSYPSYSSPSYPSYVADNFVTSTPIRPYDGNYNSAFPSTPSTSSFHPFSEKIQPKRELFRHEIILDQAASPGATPASPGPTHAYPGATPASPGATPASPGATHAYPGATSAFPGATVTPPGTTVEATPNASTPTTKDLPASSSDSYANAVKETNIHRSIVRDVVQVAYAVQKEKRSNKAMVCKFCLKNGEQEGVYRSHELKNEEGVVLCPVLRRFRCRGCGATGDNAHTQKYCPLYVFETSTITAIPRTAANSNKRPKSK